jgi:hypothetical protein
MKQYRQKVFNSTTNNFHTCFLTINYGKHLSLVGNVIIGENIILLLLFGIF